MHFLQIGMHLLISKPPQSTIFVVCLFWFLLLLRINDKNYWCDCDRFFFICLTATWILVPVRKGKVGEARNTWQKCISLCTKWRSLWYSFKSLRNNEHLSCFQPIIAIAGQDSDSFPQKVKLLDASATLTWKWKESRSFCWTLVAEQFSSKQMDIVYTKPSPLQLEKLLLWKAPLTYHLARYPELELAIS